ncbi:MAG TPA: hypothetical protein VFC46_15800, partial [Humisphaera sp.]|nr:hypothetical protein [Humisphaera sp.]
MAAPIFAADATLTLPLQGYYRPGHYMPVRVSARCDSPGAVFSLRATNALTTQIKADGDTIDATVPWLSIRTIRDVNWSLGPADHPIELPLHPLEDDERLIGYAGADADALAPSFPGKKLIRVELNVADPLPGDVTAWESLDGIVLDSSAAGRLYESTVSALLSAGTTIAIRQSQKPGGGWPWKRQGAYWIMRAGVA